MANKKNKKNKKNNTHKHVYWKKRLPKRAVKATEDARKQLEGSRIISLEQLQGFIEGLNKHSTVCDGSVILNDEERAGLASIFKGHCGKCNQSFQLETSKKVKGPRGYNRFECNLAAVWGQMATGTGHSQLQESLSAMGIPVMTKASFISTERDIGECWKRMLLSSMAEAGREEKRIAEEKGSFHEGVPAITVIVDGGWSKRSHKHSYNAKSGVAIIIGKETGKLLFIGVRNKYCHACASGKKNNHACFRNWNASSSEMETDIILEGFIEAEKVHGVRYTQFIGDGDSSVYPTLLTSVPIWGHAIKKIECANHACKCYRGALEKLVDDNPSYKGSGRLTKKMRQKLVSAARCAIRMRSKETDTREAVVKLNKDLLNGPSHCFGIHTHCSTDFCSVAQQSMQQSAMSSNVSEEAEENSEEMDDEIDGESVT